MKPRNAYLVCSKLFWSLKHDRRSLMLIIIAPIMAMFIFGLAFSGEINDVEVSVYNADAGAVVPGTNITIRLSDMILQNLDEGKIRVVPVSSMEDGVHKVETGQCNSFVTFPLNFTSSIISAVNGMNWSGGGSQLQIRSDLSQVNVVSEVSQAFMEAVSRTMNDMGFKYPLEIESGDPIYGEDAEFIDMFVPGILGFVVFLITTILTLISFVGERTNGTLDRLIASSVTEGEIVAGYAVAFSIIGMFQVIILLVLAVLVFDIIIVGNILIAFLIASLLAVVSVSLGILLSSFTRKEAQAVQFLPILVMPAFLLSGVFWPIEALPVWLRPVSYMIPVTYAVEGLRSVMLRGWGVSEIWIDLVVLGGFALVFLIGAVLTLKVGRRRA
ncbi:MAG: ABC transporter permease [Candidatus Thermoplasmatota archaeon]|nr:ABC transporter permease [Candidatus Thermoplasmatota archaeon]